MANPIKKLESIFQGIEEFQTPEGKFQVEGHRGRYMIRQLKDGAWLHVGAISARSAWQAMSKWRNDGNRDLPPPYYHGCYSNKD